MPVRLGVGGSGGVVVNYKGGGFRGNSLKNERLFGIIIVKRSALWLRE